MTPQQKAEELVDKFYTIEDSKEDNDAWIDVYLAKQCALLAADEIMQTLCDIILPNPFRQYWNKVKQEIEKL